MEAEQAREIARAELAATVEGALQRWQGEHPRATLDEIVAAVDEALRPLRARYVTDLAAQEEGAATGDRRCPECGGPLQQRGRRTRTVLVPRDPVPVRLERARLVCSSCGMSLSPPR